MGSILNDSYILKGSPVESMDVNGFVSRATVSWIVPWARRREMAFLWMDQIRRRAYPFRSQFVLMYATGVSMEPFADSQTGSTGGGSTLLLSYDHAKVTVRFGPPTASTPERPRDDLRAGGDFITESIEPLDEFLTLDHENFVWDSDGKTLKDGEDPGRMQIGLVYNFTRHGVTRLRSEYILLAEHVNNVALAPVSSMLKTMNLKFQPGTLLYKPGPLTRTIGLDGREKITVSMRFLWRQTGWNSFWRSDLVSTRRVEGADVTTAGGYDFIRLRNESATVKGKPYLNFPFGALETL